MFEQCLGVVLDLFKAVRVSPKIKIIGSGSKEPVRKSRNHRNEEFEGFPISKSKRYKFKLKQNNITELLSILFLQMNHKNCTSIAQKSKNQVFAGLSRVFTGSFGLKPRCSRFSEIVKCSTHLSGIHNHRFCPSASQQRLT